MPFNSKIHPYFCRKDKDMSIMQPGKKVRLTNGTTATVKKEIGHGGQGTVYLVNVEGKDMAMKWYYKNPGKAFYKNLSNNVHAGAPASNFIWPLAITEEIGGTFGYVMEVRPAGYEDMGNFILAKAKFANVHAQLEACLQICSAFQKLHIRGLSYQDINDGNFFINPETGAVLICDNDNVAPDGTSMGILGKAGYMAPEIIEGTKMPDRYTDYFSLAVCLFILIYMNRPFEGKWSMRYPDNDPATAKRLYGFESVFIMDPNNVRNRPVEGLHNNVIRRWGIYPSLLQRAFCRTFSSGAIKDPTKRLMDRQWSNILLQIRSMYTKCPVCGKETFIDIFKPDSRCIYCKKRTTPYGTLNVGRFSIPLVSGQPIYACMVSDEDCLGRKIGRTMTRQGMVAIENCSDTPWTVILPDGQSKIVEKGHGLLATKGFKIRFGQDETGEIK